MIVRLMGEGQYRVPDACLVRLNALDDDAMTAIDANDEPELARLLSTIWKLVRAEGSPLPDDDLSASDALVPPDDLSLDEARRLLGDDGFIPDLPAQPAPPQNDTNENSPRQGG